MRFLILVKANAESEAGKMPPTELLTAMGHYNQQLIEAGVMQAGEGLKPSSAGARVHFKAGAASVQTGPFPLTEDLVSGFWLWQCAALDEAIEWIKRSPFQNGSIEIRPIFEMEDFGAALSPEARAQETAQRERLSGA
jgi:hypothetical protein